MEIATFSDGLEQDVGNPAGDTAEGGSEASADGKLMLYLSVMWNDRLMEIDSTANPQS